MLLIRLEKFTKSSLESLESTNPQSERLCTNGGNSRPLLPSREVVDQQISLIIVCEVKKVPRVSSKQLKPSLTLANVKNTGQPWCAWQSCKKNATVLQKENVLLNITWTSQRTIGERLNEWMKPKQNLV